MVEPGAHEIAGIRLEAVPLFGHSPGQLGYLAGDVFFCADVVLPENVLDKYRIPYLFSLTEHLAALDGPAAHPTGWRLPVMGRCSRMGSSGRIDLNAALARRVAEAILELTATPRTAEAILEGILRRFDAPVVDAPSFYLLQPTVFAFLSHLHRSGQ